MLLTAARGAVAATGAQPCQFCNVESIEVRGDGLHLCVEGILQMIILGGIDVHLMK